MLAEPARAKEADTYHVAGCVPLTGTRCPGVLASAGLRLPDLHRRAIGAGRLYRFVHGWHTRRHWYLQVVYLAFGFEAINSATHRELRNGNAPGPAKQYVHYGRVR